MKNRPIPLILSIILCIAIGMPSHVQAAQDALRPSAIKPHDRPFQRQISFNGPIVPLNLLDLASEVKIVEGEGSQGEAIIDCSGLVSKLKRIIEQAAQKGAIDTLYLCGGLYEIPDLPVKLHAGELGNTPQAHTFGNVVVRTGYPVKRASYNYGNLHI